MSTEKKPTLHLNGTSRARLSETFLAAYHATKRAIDAVGEAAPNGRDYYPQGPDALNEAVREHRERMHALMSVQQDMMELAEHVME
jgi:hypothetical protein